MFDSVEDIDNPLCLDSLDGRTQCTEGASPTNSSTEERENIHSTGKQNNVVVGEVIFIIIIVIGMHEISSWLYHHSHGNNH